MKYSPFLRDHSMENSDLRVSISNTVAWSALISTLSLFVADAEPEKSGLKNQIIKVSNNRHLKIYLFFVLISVYFLQPISLILRFFPPLTLLPSRIFIARKYRNQKLMKKWHAPSCLASNLSLKKSSEILQKIWLTGPSRKGVHLFEKYNKARDEDSW